MRRLAIVLIACVGAASASPGFSQTPPPPAPGGVLGGSGPIDVSAESQARIATNPDHWVFAGNVEVTQGQARLRSPRIDLFYPARGQGGGDHATTAGGGLGHIERIEAEGPVYYVTPAQSAKGDHGTYIAADDSITLTGNVVLTQGQSVSTGDKVVMHQKTGQAVLTAGKAGRTRGVFYPNQPAPAPPPGPSPPPKPARS